MLREVGLLGAQYMNTLRSTGSKRRKAGRTGGNGPEDKRRVQRERVKAADREANRGLGLGIAACDDRDPRRKTAQSLSECL